MSNNKIYKDTKIINCHILTKIYVILLNKLPVKHKFHHEIYINHKSYNNNNLKRLKYKHKTISKIIK